ERLAGKGLRHRERYVLSLLVVLAAVCVGLVAALPAFAAEKSDPEFQVVGGTDVPAGKYPFMTSLQYDRAGTSPRQDHFCGATLIAPSYILTAAHCSVIIGNGSQSQPIPVQRVKVVVGTTRLNSSQGQARRISGVSSIHVHPKYTGRNSDYDAAVIRLDRPVNGIKPILLDNSGSNALENPGRLVTVAGWGDTKAQPATGGTAPRLTPSMREARPPIVSDTKCRTAYATTGDPSLRVAPGLMVCAGKKGVDTCQGDSGGPMFASTRAGIRQIGITSYGVGCATARFPGVYTEVSAPSINQFIRQTVPGAP
ncbi:MAG TPA: serine protease, partial [Rubrobacteraceae bacterium]|nr:serine protease [Rubrobacteraceae bacterium]